MDALKSFDKAADLAAKSFYLANLRAVAAMNVDGLQEATPRFKEVLSAVEKSGDQSVYARGTAVNAYLALGDADTAREELTAINDLDESKQTLRSISRYYNSISDERRKIDPDFDFQWASVLRC